LRIGPILLILSLQLAFLVLGGRSLLYPIGLSAAGSALILENRTDFESMASALNKKGMKALAPATIVGKSGVKHEFAFALIPDSGKATVVVDTELSVKEVDEMKVLKFYVKVFDVGPEKAVLCVCPKLASGAATLAKEYGIVVLEDDVPRRLIPMAEKIVKEAVNRSGK